MDKINLNYLDNYSFNYSQSKKRLNNKNNFSFLLIFLLIILLLGLCVMLAPTQKEYNTFYYVEIANFQTYKEAIKMSAEVQEKGGAGYIYFDTTYHVLASFYATEEDAKKVQQNTIQDYQNSKVFTLEIKNFKAAKTLSKSQNLSIENVIKETKKIIFKLDDISIKFSLNEISFNEISIHIKNLQKEFNSAKENFLNQFKTNSKFNKAKETILDISSCFENLTLSNEGDLSSTLRYEIIHLSVQLHNISNCF